MEDKRPNTTSCLNPRVHFAFPIPGKIGESSRVIPEFQKPFCSGPGWSSVIIVDSNNIIRQHTSLNL